VLLTSDCVGGVWTYSLDLARGLRAAGAEVVLATMGAPLTADQRAAAESVGLDALHESEFALEWMESPWTAVDAAGEWLLELADAEAVDVVHSNSFAHGALDWKRPVVVVGHSCVVSWWRAVEGSEPPREWDEYRHRVSAGLCAADAVVAPTRAMLCELERAYGLQSGIVVANGSSARETTAEKEPFVLAAGRMWDRAKGLDLLDQAAARLEWPVLAAGEGGTGQHVRALGRQSPRELARLRERAAIFVAPARYEPFGLAILEAARAGCALVLADIPSLRELWSGAAVFVDPRDRAALHAELAHLIAAPAERARLARAAQMHAHRYSVERMVREYLALYARVASAREEVAA
jgi:glycosyltransferase involved in cell wall biosynthesis